MQGHTGAVNTEMGEMGTEVQELTNFLAHGIHSIYIYIERERERDCNHNEVKARAYFADNDKSYRGVYFHRMLYSGRKANQSIPEHSEKIEVQSEL